MYVCMYMCVYVYMDVSLFLMYVRMCTVYYNRFFLPGSRLLIGPLVINTRGLIVKSKSFAEDSS